MIRTENIQTQFDDNQFRMKEDYFLIATDLEPDDILFLRIFLKKLTNGIVHILVGEGNIPASKIIKVKEILNAAVNDGILKRECLIEVFAGSSTKETNDFIHTFYNRKFFNSSDDIVDMIDMIDIKKSRDIIVQTIMKTKNDGGNVRIFGLKPLTDLLDIVERANTVLDNKDEILLSGSYNFREVAKDAPKINTLLNNGLYNTIVFESYTTYEKNKLLKEIMHSTNLSVNELADFIRDDNSKLGIIQKASIEAWNCAVSYDCIRDCIKPLINIISSKDLENYSKSLEGLFLDTSNKVNNINSEFIKLLNISFSVASLFLLVRNVLKPIII